MEKRIEDWKDLRYGMFIHWGLYSLLERGEWVMWSEAIDKDEYRKLMHRFTAEAFDPHAYKRQRNTIRDIPKEQQQRHRTQRQKADGALCEDSQST